MSSRATRWIVLFSLLLCLPVQGVAALVLPVCMAHEEPAAVSAHVMAAGADHCDRHSTDARPGKSVSACDQCFACHLSVAQALMPFMVALQVTAAASGLSVDAAQKTSIVPLPLFRPPISFQV